MKTQIGVCADLLDRGKLVNALSLPVTVAAAMSVPLLAASGWLPGVWTAFAMAVALIGIVELWFAMRARLDAALLRRIEHAPGALDTSLSQFDAAMTALRLMPESKAGRGVAARLSGCMRLLRWQVIAACVQIAMLLVGAPLLGLLD